MMVDYIKDNYHKNDKVSGRIFGFFLSIQIVNLSLKSMKIITSDLLTIFLAVLFISYIIYNYRKLKTDFFVYVILMEIIFLVFMLLSCLEYPESIYDIVSECFYTIAFGIPLFAAGRKVQDIKCFLKQTVLPSYFIFTVCFCMWFFYYLRLSHLTYSMSVGYIMLYPTLLFLYLSHKHSYYLIPFVLSSIIIFSIGSRGPLLSVVTGCFFFIWNKWVGINCKLSKIIILIVMLLIVLLMFIFSQEVVGCLSEFMLNLNIKSRNLEYILEGGMLRDSGRGKIFMKFISAIDSSPIFGYGVASYIPAFGYYPHNIFLELVYSFGIIIGGVLSVFLVIKIFAGFFEGNQELKDANRVVILTVFPMLLLSGTFLKTPVFWLMLGLITMKTRYRLTFGRY